MANEKLKYTRISSLPQLRDIKDSDFYSAAYDRWSEGKIGTLNKLNPPFGLKDVLKSAFEKIVAEYKIIRENATTSMVRNFATKLLFRFDQCVGNLLSNWHEKLCVKILADNVIKEQDFLFYLFLTYLGCDVLLVENRSDADVATHLLNYSHKIELGNIGFSELAPYVKYVPEKKYKNSVSERSESVSKSETQNIRIVIPEKPSRQRLKYIDESESIITEEQRVIQTPAGTDTTLTNVNSEKTFEELALLASSVVLIAIHDSEGDIIGTGSGIMIGKSGFILTNNHVATGGRFYSVRIEDDEEVYLTDEVIKYNSTTDLAVIRIKRQLKPIPIYKGKNKLVRGQKVVAIGSPLGLFNSVSDGIISGFRNINDVDMIQFTAPISHGSSGGAVLNMQGEIIGISTAGIDSGQNINLAIGYESIRLFAHGLMN